MIGRDTRAVALKASAEAPRGLDQRYFTRDEVVALFLSFQDSVVAGLRLRQSRSTDYLQADAYEQAARIVLATPLDPPKEG